MKHLTHVLCVGLLLISVTARGEMIVSGDTAKATVSDTAIDVLTSTSGVYSKIILINEGSVAGFFSIDGGTTWARLPAGPSSIQIEITESTLAPVQKTVSLKVKRVASGSNLSGIWAWAN